MKHIIFLITFVVAINTLHGMEKIKEQKFRTFICPMIPQVVVIQDDIYNRCTKSADITIFGETEQIHLNKSELFPSPTIGCMVLTHDNSIMRRNKVFTKYFDYSYGYDDDSAAIIVEGERFIIMNPYSYIEHKKMDNQFFLVKEPQLFFTELQGGQSIAYRYMYEKMVQMPKKTMLERQRYSGYQAIEEALKDLRHCYTSVLTMVHTFFTREHEARSIALPQLSVSLGIPAYRAAQVAVAAVVEFITLHSNKNTYGLIELVVQDSENFKLYKNLLIERALLRSSFVQGYER